MIKTTSIPAAVLSSMQDAVRDHYDLNALLRGSLPDALAYRLSNLARWGDDWRDELIELAERSDSAEGVELSDDWELFHWAAYTLASEVKHVTGMGTVQVLDMVKGETGWDNLYLFTAPMSNVLTRTVAVWADDAEDAVEGLMDWLREQGEEDGCFSDEIELDIELWTSSPAYCFERD